MKQAREAFISYMLHQVLKVFSTTNVPYTEIKELLEYVLIPAISFFILVTFDIRWLSYRRFLLIHLFVHIYGFFETKIISIVVNVPSILLENNVIFGIISYC